MELKNISDLIFEIRGQKVMLDYDLAALYEVETRALNQAVKRNHDLFPIDFMFRINDLEWEERSSQIVMTSNFRPKTALPMAFTEHGITMLASVLKSKKARQTSIAIVRAFIALKHFAFNYSELSDKLNEIENRYDKNFNDVFEALNYLLQKDKLDLTQKERKRIGFKST